MLNNCLLIDLSLRKDGLQVHRDIGLGGLVELRHRRLGEPEGALVEATSDAGAAILGGVEDELDPGGDDVIGGVFEGVPVDASIHPLIVLCHSVIPSVSRSRARSRSPRRSFSRSSVAMGS